MATPADDRTEGGAPAQPVRGDAPTAGRGGAQPSEEEQLWAEVERHWGDPAAHKGYLDRCSDLDGLTVAGRRYRAVLEARPVDAVALAMKGEVLKRATVVGMAMLPRTAPPPLVGGKWKRRLIILAASWLASTVAWLAWKLFGGSTP